MDTPTKESTQPNEAGFSTNLFLNHDKMGRVQFTFRGATSTDWGVVLEDVDRFLHYMHDKGWQFDGEHKAVTVTEPGEPERVAIGDDGKPLPPIITTTAERMEFGLFKGKLSAHVIAKPWTKFGIPLYDETWIAAGFDFKLGDVEPDIAGWTVEYICKPDGKPQKVTRLLKPK